MASKISEVHFKCPFCRKKISILIDGTPYSKAYPHVCTECSKTLQVACKVSKDIIVSVQVR